MFLFFNKVLGAQKSRTLLKTIKAMDLGAKHPTIPILGYVHVQYFILLKANFNKYIKHLYCTYTL